MQHLVTACINLLLCATLPSETFDQSTPPSPCTVLFDYHSFRVLAAMHPHPYVPSTQTAPDPLVPNPNFQPLLAPWLLTPAP